MGQDEVRETLTLLEEQMRVARQKQSKEAPAKNLEEGKAFLEKNKEKQGVKTLPDGLQYNVLSEGNGPSPKATDMVTVNYRGSLMTGPFLTAPIHGESRRPCASAELFRPGPRHYSR